MNIAPEVKQIFDAWPKKARQRAIDVRALIVDIADDIQKKHSLRSPVEEMLKWGEPAYRLTSGSTLRMGYKDSRPEVLSLYFVCSTSLVDTFRKLHGDDLELVGNRELRIPTTGRWPVKIVADCIGKTLEYHKVKHLKLLGG